MPRRSESYSKLNLKKSTDLNISFETRSENLWRTEFNWTIPKHFTLITIRSLCKCLLFSSNSNHQTIQFVFHFALFAVFSPWICIWCVNEVELTLFSFMGFQRIVFCLEAWSKPGLQQKRNCTNRNGFR